MQPFELLNAESRQDAINKATTIGAKFIGGGTNLIDLMKLDIEKPKHIVNIKGLGLDKIQVMADGSVLIGALVKNSDLAYDDNIARRFPVLSQALLSGASPQLRNMATVGGNLMQRTRCPYFYDTAFACNKRRPGSGCDAMKGYNRNNAILGTSYQCIATHPSDMCVALAALNASVQVEGPDGKRTIAFNDFHLVPGDTPNKETSLEQGELITGVLIPLTPFATRSLYIKVRDRASYDFALASVAVAMDLNGTKIKDVRIALGGVGTKPWRSYRAEKVLIGGSADRESFQLAANTALDHAAPRQHNMFKVELAKRVLIRALETVTEMS